MSVAGGPDLSFGTGGEVPLPVIANVQYGAKASVTQPDGKVVVVGSLSSIPGTLLGGMEFVAARYNSNGTLDATFGSGGFFSSPSLSVITTIGNLFTASADAVALQPDGKIVVAGNVSGGAKVVRLDAHGTLDATFGSGGIVTLGGLNLLGTQLNYATSLAILPDGKIAVGGADEPTVDHDLPAVEMLNANGSVDTTFGAQGQAVVPLPSYGLLGFLPIVPILSNGTYLTGSPVRIVAQADGKIVIDANADVSDNPAISDIVSTRFTTTGILDPTYGGNGATVITPSAILPFAGSVTGASLAIQPDGKLVIGGSITFGTSGQPRMLAVRLGTNGLLDPTFGVGGANILGGITPVNSTVAAIAFQADGKIVLADGTAPVFARLNPNGLPDASFGTAGTSLFPTANPFALGGSVGVSVLANGKITATQGGPAPGLVRLLGRGATGDYDGDGVSDPAIYITSVGTFAYQASSGFIAPSVPFGSAGAGQSLPAPGAYLGDGQDNLAIYLPASGAFAVRSLSTGLSVVVPFGIAGAGNSIPAPGDYDHSGRTEFAVYLPTLGAYAYRSAKGGPDVIIPFGPAGAGQSIPVPADYYGTGQDDVAVYLAAAGAFAIKDPTGATPGEVIPFGIPGLGNSIPVPGDYDGSGHAELAVYLPSLGDLIYRPANGGPDVIEPFGIKGAGMTLPAPGDYDGSGKTEVAAYFPTLGLFAYRPANGGPDVIEPFGAANQTIPFAPPADAEPVTTVTIGGVGNAAMQASVVIPLTPDVLDEIAGPSAKKAANHG